MKHLKCNIFKMRRLSVPLRALLSEIANNTTTTRRSVYCSKPLENPSKQPVEIGTVSRSPIENHGAPWSRVERTKMV